MNKFDEFDKIKTPSIWKETILANDFRVSKKKREIRIKYILAMVLVIIIITTSSIGITYALSESFRIWINECFGNNVSITDSRDLLDGINGDTIVLKQGKGSWYVEDGFIGVVDDNYFYNEVYVLENDKLVACSINQYQGNIEGENYSFKYVRYNNRILGFDYQGCIIDVLPRIVDNKIYVCIDMDRKYDLAKVDLVTGELEYITSDHISLNPIISPNQINILINKNDQAWVNYNIETGNSNEVTNINPYMHSNCITFIDENTVITYDGNDGILLDVLKDTVTPLDNVPLEGTLVNIYDIGDKIVFTNVINGNKCEMDHIYILGTYCSLDYVALFNNEELYLYDINHNKVVDLNNDKKLDEEIEGVSIIDKEHLLISTDKRVYILAKEYINS